jgi:hypothetical protein
MFFYWTLKWLGVKIPAVLKATQNDEVKKKIPDLFILLYLSV